MKKLALAMITASAVMFGFGSAASAQNYVTSIAVGTPGPGAAYSSTYTNCVPGETITFVQPQSTPVTVTGVCSATRVAVGNFTAAPTTAGTFTVTGTGTTSPARTASFAIALTTLPDTGAPAGGGAVAPQVPGGGLPATGSNGIGTTTTIALSLLVVGFGLFAVAQLRRRQTSLA